MYDRASKGPDFVMEDPTVEEAPLSLTADLFLVEAPVKPENLLRVSFLSELNLVLEKANWLPSARTLITNFQIMPLDPMLPESVKMTLTKLRGGFISPEHAGVRLDCRREIGSPGEEAFVKIV